MESKCSNFGIGLGLGSVLGAIIYRYSCTSKAKRLKCKVLHALYGAGDEAEDLVDAAKDKAVNAGEKVVDKVADTATNAAEKADEVKNKVHNFADNAKM